MSLLHRCLLLLPPEMAHDIAVFFLKWWGRLKCPFGVKAPGRAAVIHPTLSRLRFGSRVGLAAGFDKNGLVMPAIRGLGFGFVEVGTVTPLPQAGNPKPRLWRVPPDALVNHFGFNSDGIVAVRSRVITFKMNNPDFPLFLNVGKNRNTENEKALRDYELGLDAFRDIADGFVVNLSSPNTPGLTELQGRPFLEGLASVLPRGAVVFIKISADLDPGRFEEVVSFVAGEKRFSGLVVSNTSRTLAEARGFEKGGLSGAPIFERSLEAVAKAKSLLRENQVLIGVGGISSLADAKRMRQAGADLVEVYTSFVYQGPTLIRQLSELA